MSRWRAVYILMRQTLWIGWVLALASCGGTSPSGGGGTDTETSSEGSLTAATSLPTTGTTDPTAATGNMTQATTVATSDAASSSTATDPSADSSGGAGSGSSSGAATGNDPNNPLDCGGTVYACGNGIDDDGDGETDLEDPECTGPCDDDEGSFATGIPGDNMDCKQDCFFDGNSGQGDDGCIWNLRCDPENPGAEIGCEYTGNGNCDNASQASWDQECLDFCLPFVPPGCDCFGCCTVETDEGEVHIFLNSDKDGECSLDNLDACQSCTPNDECSNDCDGECELCFGQDELPPRCEEAECNFGDPCDTIADCPSDWYCLQDCCIPPPPG